MRRTTQQQKKAKGTARSGREKVVVMPPPVNDLIAPIQLSESAKKEWDEIAPTLSTDQLLTGLDKKMLMMYCEEMAKYWALQAELLTEDFMLELTDSKGNVVNYMKNPKMDLSDKALTNAHKIGMHFGLTPLSRTKINIPHKKQSTPEEDNLDKLKGMRNKVINLKTA